MRLNIGCPVVRTDGRAGGVRSRDYLLNFLGWVDLLTRGALQARFARQSSAISQDSIPLGIRVAKTVFKRQEKKSVMMHKTLHGTTPKYLRSSFFASTRSLLVTRNP